MLILSIESGSCVSIKMSVPCSSICPRWTYKNPFVEIIQSVPNLFYPICHYDSGILTMDPQNFQTLHSSDFFPTCKNIYIININNSCINASSIHNKTCQRNLTPLHWNTNSNVLFYLIWNLWPKISNWIIVWKRKLQKHRAAALGNMRKSIFSLSTSD